MPDGSWNPGFVDGLQTSLLHLVEDDIPSIFSGARLEPGLPRLFRRKTAGNLVFQVTNDGRLLAYSADKGEKLLEVKTDLGGGMGPPRMAGAGNPGRFRAGDADGTAAAAGARAPLRGGAAG